VCPCSQATQKPNPPNATLDLNPTHTPMELCGVLWLKHLDNRKCGILAQNPFGTHHGAPKSFQNFPSAHLARRTARCGRSGAACACAGPTGAPAKRQRCAPRWPGTPWRLHLWRYGGVMVALWWAMVA